MKFLIMLSTIYLCCQFSVANAQEVGRVNTFYLESFGQGFVPASFHYEQKYKETKKGYRSAGIGFVYMPAIFGFGSGTYIGLPIHVNWILGREEHHFFTGMGLTPMFTWSENTLVKNHRSELYLTPKLGYRYQPRNGGLFFSATLNLMVGIFEGDSKSSNLLQFNQGETLGFAPVFPWPGIAIGWCL